MSIMHENINPVMIPEDHNEFLVVDIGGKFGSIRIINCYGPQKNWSLETRTEFFIELDTRIISAKTIGQLICIQFDANSKLGNAVIPGDPNEMSSNGKILIQPQQAGYR